MENHNENKSILKINNQRCEDKIKEMINSLKYFVAKYKTVFIVTMLIGLIAHAFCFTNKLLNNDEINNLFGKGGTLKMGRWGLGMLNIVFPSFSMPWFNGITTLFLIGISVCLVLEILEVKNKIFQYIIAGLMITFPTIISTFSYMFTSNSYAVGILLSILSVYLFIKKQRFFEFLAIIVLIFSISIYQAYISITASLFLILIIKECINVRKSFKEIILFSLKCLLLLSISLVIYFIITKVLIKIFDIHVTSYQGVDEIGKISIKTIWNGVLQSYESLKLIITKNWNSLALADVFIKIVYVMAMFLSMYLGIMIGMDIIEQDFNKIIPYILCFALLPIAMNMLFILNANVRMHTLMVYGNVIILILPLVLIENITDKMLEKIFKNLFIIVYLIVIYKYIIAANESYLKMHMAYEHSYSFYNTMVSRIQMTEGYDQNTKIALVGKYEGNQLFSIKDNFENIKNLIGILDSKSLIVSHPESFIKKYIGSNLKFVSEREIEKLKQTEEVENMNIYPYDDSIKKIGNTIVVKFSN